MQHVAWMAHGETLLWTVLFKIQNSALLTERVGNLKEKNTVIVNNKVVLLWTSLSKTFRTCRYSYKSIYNLEGRGLTGKQAPLTDIAALLVNRDHSSPGPKTRKRSKVTLAMIKRATGRVWSKSFVIHVFLQGCHQSLLSSRLSHTLHQSGINLCFQEWLTMHIC